VVSGLDILIIRELTGDIYFGQPRGVRECPDGPFKGQREGFDTMRYAEGEIRRIAHVAFQAAQKRGKRVTSVDKANVLETFQFWRDIVTDVHKEYRTSSSTTCTSTTPRCSWCARRRSST
jgi:3-isopropylmalate dehydrogenase